MPSIYQDKQCRLQRSEWKFHSGGNASSEQLDRRQSAEAVPLFGTRVRLGLVRLDMGFIAKSGFQPRLHGGRFGFELEMFVPTFVGLTCLATYTQAPGDRLKAFERRLPSEAERPFSNVSDRCPATPRRPWHASPRISRSRLVGLPFIAAQSPVRPRKVRLSPNPSIKAGNSNFIHRSFYDRFKKILIDGCVVSYGSPWSSGESQARTPHSGRAVAAHRLSNEVAGRRATNKRLTPLSGARASGRR
jgi:hypothetical protein